MSPSYYDVVLNERQTSVKGAGEWPPDALSASFLCVATVFLANLMESRQIGTLRCRSTDCRPSLPWRVVGHFITFMLASIKWIPARNSRAFLKRFIVCNTFLLETLYGRCTRVLIVSGKRNVIRNGAGNQVQRSPPKSR